MKKLIPLAVASAVLGINTAQAVHVNPDGLGQVLLYPYYTVEGGQTTLINLVNTTDRVKAVKVRFRESMNSQEVLDFNLYLSPYDHWSAAIYDDGEGASIKTADTSCTLPTKLSDDAAAKIADPTFEIPGVAFKDILYSGDSAPWNGIDRTREGYVEVIEMGLLDNSTLENAATHIDGVPPGCNLLAAAFQAGIWSGGAVNTDISAPEGGLYGYGILMDVNEGTDATYDAVALSDWTDSPQHALPGNSLPELADGDAFGDIIDLNAIIPIDFSGVFGGIDAVSAVLMKSSILNDYVLEPTVQAGTDWVITFPTKRPYVQGPVTSPAREPFTTNWNSISGQACDEVDLGYWNREEEFIQPDPDDLQFSPRPPVIIDVFSVCHEANVMTFNESNVLSPSVRTKLDLSVNFDNGWAEMDLDPSIAGVPKYNRVLTGINGAVVRGLPVIGFAVQKYVNGELVVDGTTVLSNYAGSVSHKTVVDAVPAP